MKIYSALTVMAIVALSSCNNTDKPASKNDDAMLSNNPFLNPSTLPFQTADFTKIKDSDFKPAIEEGIKQQLAETEKIANDTSAPTFENTFVAMEKSGQMRHRVEGVFNLLTGANTDPELQKVSEEVAPELAAANDAIFLNSKLFKRVDAIYKQRENLKLDPESKRLVEFYHQKFVLSGANLSDNAKDSLKKINSEEASLSAKYTNQLLAAAKSAALVVSDKAELAGLSDGELDAAAQAAKANKQDGKWMIKIQNTTQQPALQSLTVRATRKKLFEASWSRAEKNDSNDTRSTISRIALIRAQKAKLLGYPNFASWALVNQMAKNEG
ncbi:MAG TPA: M3 family metallopeptidase, partial [Bacteroidia bacterium]|nr:M3 family metallopeptidase [Bacteroidia bacterium]